MELNTHWHEWREAVKRTGYTPALQLAAKKLEELDRATPDQVEQIFVRLMDQKG